VTTLPSVSVPISSTVLPNATSLPQKSTLSPNETSKVSENLAIKTLPTIILAPIELKSPQVSSNSSKKQNVSATDEYLEAQNSNIQESEPVSSTPPITLNTKENITINSSAIAQPLVGGPFNGAQNSSIQEIQPTRSTEYVLLNTTETSKVQNESLTTVAAEPQSSTQPPIDPMLYKDDILRQGISAVANLLLEQVQTHVTVAQFKQALDENAEYRQTTEIEEPTTENYASTVTEEIETSTTEEIEPYTDDGKLEVRHDSIDITESYAETTVTPENLVQPSVKPQTKLSHILPTKESKLNPDDREDFDEHLVELKLETPHTTSDSGVNTTSAPESTVASEEKSTTAVPPLSEKSAGNSVEKLKKPGSSTFNSPEQIQRPSAVDLHPAPHESMGLEATTAFLNEDVRRFSDLCNELAFRLWTSITGKGQISSRSLVVSPFAATSLLAMVFLGARGPTSGQMNEILRLDDMVTFNPHQVFKNVTESVINSKNYGVATASFVRQLYSDKVVEVKHF
jgi:hypothetical protein